jgi:phage shock protein C
MQRKLYRSRTDSRIAGVCGGLGEYLDVDPTIIRLIFVLLALTGGHGVLLYIILWLVMPHASQGQSASH